MKLKIRQSSSQPPLWHESKRITLEQQPLAGKTTSFFFWAALVICHQTAHLELAVSQKKNGSASGGSCIRWIYDLLILNQLICLVYLPTRDIYIYIIIYIQLYTYMLIYDMYIVYDHVCIHHIFRHGSRWTFQVKLWLQNCQPRLKLSLPGQNIGREVEVKRAAWCDSRFHHGCRCCQVSGQQGLKPWYLKIYMVLHGCSSTKAFGGNIDIYKLQIGILYIYYTYIISRRHLKWTPYTAASWLLRSSINYWSGGFPIALWVRFVFGSCVSYFAKSWISLWFMTFIISVSIL